MVLKVELEVLADEIERHAPGAPVYIAAYGKGSLATAAAPGIGFVMASLSPLSVPVARAQLEKKGLEVREGGWSLEGETLTELRPEFWVACVAYRSRDPKPGLWVSTYPTRPAPAAVLRDVYDEFVETGELADVPFEEFLRLSFANVLIVEPTSLEQWARDRVSDVQEPVSHTAEIPALAREALAADTPSAEAKEN